MMRILPSSTRSSPNGAAPKPTSTCPVIVWVMVAAIVPVDVGMAVSLYCAMSASSPAFQAVLLENTAALAELSEAGVPRPALRDRDLQRILRPGGAVSPHDQRECGKHRGPPGPGHCHYLL